jgi:DNA-directed RNA polymerase subunit M/transcription elongation factor TFIIS
MDFEQQIELQHLIFTERKCRVCGEVKDLLDGFYLTRKGRGDIPSAYSYECKVCTVQRITSSRKKINSQIYWEYPDW